MAIPIILERQRIFREDYSLDFNFVDAFRGGFSFPCDKEGNVFPFNSEAAEANYNSCINGNYNVIPGGVRIRKWSYIEPAIGKCHCGRQVPLEDHYCGACACECGQWYNMSGQELIPPQHWEESIDYDY